MSINLLEQLMSEESHERNDADVAMQILLDYINILLGGGIAIK